MRRETVWYFVLTVCQLVAIFVFAIGYFPSKKLLKGDAEPYDMAVMHNISEQEPQFKKLVVVVIDALRSDFLYQKDISHFHNLHGLLNQGKAIGFTAYSNPPTVTLPRLKGITTGSTPIFLDAILNVAEGDSSSTLEDQDSIIKQFYKSGSFNKIKFYGDDTWLKLFGNDRYFVDFEGTNSFFVSDFIEVDHNVTRHVKPNMDRQDEWDVLILHYLGLDHIGHKGGAYSPFMKPKQIEMDEIIFEQLYNKLDDDTLMVVLGDHGMNDLGNHGGSSAGETSSALCFISKKFEFSEQEHAPVVHKNADYQYLQKTTQIDLVPTLMALFHLPIPINNVGVIIPELLPWIGDNVMQRFHIEQNYKQLIRLAGNNTPDKDKKNKDVNELFSEMLDIQEQLLQKSTEYNHRALLYGIALFVIVNVITLYTTFEISVHYMLIVGISVLLGVSTFGSSFIEEEHQIWWWVTILFYCGCFLLKGSSFSFKSWFKFIIGLCCLRVIRGWNNSGQKFQYDSVLSKLIPSKVLWYVNLVAVMLPSCYGSSSSSSKLVFIAMLLLGSYATFAYKLNWCIINEHLNVSDWPIVGKIALSAGIHTNEDLVENARSVFKFIGSCLLVNKIYSITMNKTKRGIDEIQINLITFFLIVQSDSKNIPLFGIFYILKQCTIDVGNNSSIIPQEYIPIWTLLLEHLSFFQFGGTNSINTVNLTNAYNGISNNYNIITVGLLMNISNYSPSIYWGLVGTTTHSKQYKRDSLIFSTVFGGFLVLSCFISKYHLFVWSVFSPKLCYYIASSLFMNVIVKYIFAILV